ncbi:MAG: hypothetical protein AB1515_02235, partial [Nitrospirota bacterium]
MNDDAPSLERQRIQALAAALADQLDPGELEELIGRLHSAGDAARAAILGLGLLVAERSAKATAEYLRQAPLLAGRLEAEEWGPWVGVGVNIASKSAVAAVRYFRESPAMLAEVTPAPVRRAILNCANRFSEWEPGLALEVVRQAPAVIRLLPDEDFDQGHAHRLDLLRRWTMAGEQLAGQDRVLASEYFQRSPQLLMHVPPALLAEWAQLGGTLVQPNRLGKPDYLPALEFFRLSPEWLAALTPSEARARLLQLVRRLTDEPPERRVGLLRQAPQWLQAIPSADQRLWLLEQASALSAQSPEAAAALLERGRDLIRRFFLRAPQLDGSAGDRIGLAAEPEGWRHRLAEWIRYGQALLARSPDTGLAYFRLESSASEQRLDHAAGGLSLRGVARTLTLFAEGLSGQSVQIKPTAEPLPDSPADALPDALPVRRGRIIFLPPFVSDFGSAEENFRYYRIMTAYQAAQMEFAAFQVDADALAAVARTTLAEREPAPATPDEFFARLAFPLLARDLWAIAEGGRIDARLRSTYPGLRRDLDLVVAYTLSRRPSMQAAEPTAETIAAMDAPSLIEQVMERLLQLSMAGRTAEPIPAAQQPLIDELCRLLLRAQQPGATAADALRAACDAYALLVERFTGGMDRLAQRPSATVDAGTNPLGVAGDPIQAAIRDRYEPLAMPRYRGRQDNEPADSPAGLDDATSIQRTESSSAAGAPSSEGRPGHGSLSPATGDAAAASGQTAQHAAAFAAESAGSEGTAAQTALVRYPEWDEASQDYRPAWCVVR